MGCGITQPSDTSPIASADLRPGEQVLYEIVPKAVEELNPRHRQAEFRAKVCLITGMVYDYLPFMIYPIYNILEKMDKSYAEAAADLGATPWQVFWKVQVPLSMPT